jgi:hypothetical protein
MLLLLACVDDPTFADAPLQAALLDEPDDAFPERARMAQPGPARFAPDGDALPEDAQLHGEIVVVDPDEQVQIRAEAYLATWLVWVERADLEPVTHGRVRGYADADRAEAGVELPPGHSAVATERTVGWRRVPLQSDVMRGEVWLDEGDVDEVYTLEDEPPTSADFDTVLRGATVVRATPGGTPLVTLRDASEERPRHGFLVAEVVRTEGRHHLVRFAEDAYRVTGWVTDEDVTENEFSLSCGGGWSRCGGWGHGWMAKRTPIPAGTDFTVAAGTAPVGRTKIDTHWRATRADGPFEQVVAETPWGEAPLWWDTEAEPTPVGWPTVPAEE